MSYKRQKSTFGVNVGTSSLLLVFVILCLVSFATLSLVSANADQKLNQKIIDKNAAYYNACNSAEEKLSSIDATLMNIYLEAGSAEEYFNQAGEYIDFAIPISDIQSLSVSVKIKYPSNEGDTLYDIEKWNIITTGTLKSGDDDNKLNLLF